MLSTGNTPKIQSSSLFTGGLRDMPRRTPCLPSSERPGWERTSSSSMYVPHQMGLSSFSMTANSTERPPVMDPFQPVPPRWWLLSMQVTGLGKVSRD